jgi:hypothetical protein
MFAQARWRLTAFAYIGALLASSLAAHAPPSSSPSSPAVFRLDRHLPYRDGKVDLELAPWALSHSLFNAIRDRRRTHAGTGCVGRAAFPASGI